MASKQVTTIQETPLAAWKDAAGNDWEDDGTSDAQPIFPVIKIVQGTSTMDGAGRHGGDFWHSDSETFDSTLNVVALLKRETRAMFEADSDAPVCMSADGVFSLPNMPLWDGRETVIAGGEERFVPISVDTKVACEGCPFSRWQEDGTPPPCKQSSVLLVDRGEAGLAQLRVAGKSLKPLRQFIGRKCAPKKIPLYAYRLTLSTEEKNEPGKKWHQLVIAGELMSPTVAKGYSDQLRAQRERFDAGLKDAGAAATDDVVAADDGWVDA